MPEPRLPLPENDLASPEELDLGSSSKLCQRGLVELRERLQRSQELHDVVHREGFP
jgi:hypothetical protein